MFTSNLVTCKVPGSLDDEKGASTGKASKGLLVDGASCNGDSSTKADGHDADSLVTTESDG